MSHTEFCYWLQGFLEVSKAKRLTEEQVKCVKEHLALVFVKVTKGFGQYDLPALDIAKILEQGGLGEPTKYC